MENTLIFTLGFVIVILIVTIVFLVAEKNKFSRENTRLISDILSERESKKAIMNTYIANHKTLEQDNQKLTYKNVYLIRLLRLVDKKWINMIINEEHEDGPTNIRLHTNIHGERKWFKLFTSTDVTEKIVLKVKIAEEVLSLEHLISAIEVGEPTIKSMQNLNNALYGE